MDRWTNWHLGRVVRVTDLGALRAGHLFDNDARPTRDCSAGLTSDNKHPREHRGCSMPRTALTQLQEQIDIIRQEAYGEGYAAAMKAVIDFAKSNQTSAAASGASKPRAVRASKSAKAPGARAPRGQNVDAVVQALKSLPQQAGRGADIRKAMGSSISYTSLRHALGQLQARGQVSLNEDGKVWSYVGSSV